MFVFAKNGKLILVHAFRALSTVLVENGFPNATPGTVNRIGWIYFRTSFSFFFLLVIRTQNVVTSLKRRVAWDYLDGVWNEGSMTQRWDCFWDYLGILLMESSDSFFLPFIPSITD